MFKLLAIGNSFSSDATAYLHQIAASAGVENLIVNLHVNGCSLESHWSNIKNDAKKYEYLINGRRTDCLASIQQMLEEHNWDVITLQQASNDSGWKDSYEPFLPNILAYLKEQAPNAKIMLHETWAYATVNNHPNYARYDCDQQTMFRRVKDTYTAMGEKYGLSLIHSGELIQKLRQTEDFADPNGKYSLCRDGFHLDFTYGRYAAACMYAKDAMGVELSDANYIPSTLNRPAYVADPAVIERIKQLANEI